MQVSILTVGDELLAGDVVDTNASWLAAQLTDRGVEVREIVTVPDDIDVIAARITTLHDRSDALLVTGGVGGTPDDVTMDALALAFDSPLEVHDDVFEDILETVGEEDPDDVDLDVDAWSAVPAAARPIVNDAGLSPGCILESVYVFPGIPSEMKPMFEGVADLFVGDRLVRTTRSTRPESELVDILDRAMENFDVSIGSYPQADGHEKRLVIRSEDEEAVDDALEWLEQRV